MKDIIILFDIDYTLFNTDFFKKSGLKMYKLYPHVKNVLNKLNNKFTLGILSQGEKDFQINKLKKTGIYKLFNKNFIFITFDKDKDLEEILRSVGSKKVILIEDKLEMLESAKDLNNKILTVWIKNGPYVDLTKSKFVPDYVINKVDNFLNLPDVIKNFKFD